MSSLSVAFGECTREIIEIFDTVLCTVHISISNTGILTNANKSHLELGRQWKVIVFHMYFVNKRVRIFKTKNLYGNDT
jgi:hypothetical protein